MYNHSFGNWTYYGNASYNGSVDKQQWSFTAPEGPGYYHFCSIAYDNLGHVENKTLHTEATLCVEFNLTIYLHQG